MKPKELTAIFVFLVIMLSASCSKKSTPVAIKPTGYYSTSNSYGYSQPSGYSSYRSYSDNNYYQPQRSYVSTTTNTGRSLSSLKRSAKIVKDILPHSARGRTGRHMKPRYITIHSTQNWSPGANAYRHALALKNNKLGRLSWHYTVDEKIAIQHLPENERGNHADYDGPGNHYSIGIEMCEHPGNSRRETLERTAKLTAYLMHKHNISISHVVPHYHWPRWGKNPPNKNCPHFLLEDGRPGYKWKQYLAKINNYYRKISGVNRMNYVRAKKPLRAQPIETNNVTRKREKMSRSPRFTQKKTTSPAIYQFALRH